MIDLKTLYSHIVEFDTGASAFVVKMMDHVGENKCLSVISSFLEEKQDYFSAWESFIMFIKHLAVPCKE